MHGYLDLDRWPRRAAFEFFRTYDNPYFNVCAPVEAGALVELSRSHDVPFSLACHYLALRVANEYEPFRYRLSEGRVLVHDRVHAGTTALLEEERLVFVYFDYHEDFAAFRAGAAESLGSIRPDAKVIDARDDRTDLIHFSSLPWIAFTSISHARNPRPDDSVPKIMFGRYHHAGDTFHLPVSVEVHHALMDGLHVGRFFERLHAYLVEPAAALGMIREPAT